MDAPLPDFHVARLESLSLAGSGRTRSIRVPRDQRADGFAEAYDHDTLWYDAVRVAGRVHLVCPRLYNLTPLLARVTADGVALRTPRRRAWRRHEVARLAVPAEASRLSLRLGAWHGESGISADGAAHFAGLNASLHINRDNRLSWIADWARFHVAEHGLQAMLVMDNASRAYAPEDILEALSGTGLARAVVLRVPQPYGPARSRVGPGAAKFLQPAMLNLARLRYLRRARAVLNVDIDELVWSRGGSVFDAAVESAAGVVAFGGEWRLPPPRVLAPHAHADHTHRRQGAGPCPSKYCVAPGGRLGRASWDVHRLALPLPVATYARRDIGYWHCRAITTNWKGHARLRQSGVGPHDASTAAALDRVFAVPRLPGEAARASLRAEAVEEIGQKECADEG